MSLPQSVKILINYFAKLPGIGPKTAERLVFYLIKQDKNLLHGFAQSIIHVKDRVTRCQECGQISEAEKCQICLDKTRNHSQVCLVAESMDIASLEKPGAFAGIYHVLGGLINPTEGLTADKLNIKSLEEKLARGEVKEVVLAMNPTIEGETTNIFLNKIIKKYPGVKVTKLARGLPQGADLEYADEVTLANAFSGRIQV